jgi:hypothetical protein
MVQLVEELLSLICGAATPPIGMQFPQPCVQTSYCWIPG